MSRSPLSDQSSHTTSQSPPAAATLRFDCASSALEIANPPGPRTDEPMTLAPLTSTLGVAALLSQTTRVDVPLWEAAGSTSHSRPSGLMGKGGVSSSTPAGVTRRPQIRQFDVKTTRKLVPSKTTDALYAVVPRLLTSIPAGSSTVPSEATRVP